MSADEVTEAIRRYVEAASFAAAAQFSNERTAAPFTSPDWGEREAALEQLRQAIAAALVTRP